MALGDQADRDFDRILTIVLFLVILVSGFDVVASLEHWIAPGQLDVVLLALLIVAAGAIVFASRRWADLRKEIAQRHQVEIELQKAHDELEARVQERTADLVEANRQLADEVTQRQCSEQALQRRTSQLQTLSAQLVQAQEVERRMIAQELHDDVGQTLTGLKLILERSVNQASGELRDDLGEAEHLAAELLAQVREMALNLRPSMLDDLGLLPALLWQIERFTALSETHVEFQHQGLEQRFLPEVETAAYRIVQEALTNIARHAQAREAFLSVCREADSLYLSVEDHGIGFEVGSNPKLSMGLNGIEERVNALGGSWILNSQPGEGTRLEAWLPIHPSDAPAAREEPS